MLKRVFMLLFNAPQLIDLGNSASLIRHLPYESCQGSSIASLSSQFLSFPSHDLPVIHHLQGAAGTFSVTSTSPSEASVRKNVVPG